MTSVQPFKFAGTVSHGTMRIEDLIPAFEPVLAELDVELCARLQREYVGWREALASDDHDLAHTYLICLFDALDTKAPEGFYFGAHVGDGSDYGFWELSS